MYYIKMKQQLLSLPRCRWYRAEWRIEYWAAWLLVDRLVSEDGTRRKHPSISSSWFFSRIIIPLQTSCEREYSVFRSIWRDACINVMHVRMENNTGQEIFCVVCWLVVLHNKEQPLCYSTLYAFYFFASSVLRLCTCSVIVMALIFQTWLLPLLMFDMVQPLD